MNKLSSGLFSLTEWITKFAYINLLWVGFTIVGLGVFGFFPSTVSMFTIIRKWIIGETDIPMFPTFWETYKKEFVKSNGLGLVLLLAAGLSLLDLYFMKNNASNLFSLTHIPLYLFIIAVIMTAMYIIPVYVHYHVTFIQMMKNAFLIMLINPLSNIVMLLGLAGTVVVFKFLPGLSFFFGGSLTASIIMAACYLAFQRVDRKKGGSHTS